MKCCEELDQQLNPSCDIHGKECPDSVIRFYPSRWVYEPSYDGFEISKVKIPDRYGILIPDSVGGGFYNITYCPFCGVKL